MNKGAKKFLIFSIPAVIVLIFVVCICAIVMWFWSSNPFGGFVSDLERSLTPTPEKPQETRGTMTEKWQSLKVPANHTCVVCSIEPGTYVELWSGSKSTYTVDEMCVGRQNGELVGEYRGSNVISVRAADDLSVGKGFIFRCKRR